MGHNGICRRACGRVFALVIVNLSAPIVKRFGVTGSADKRHGGYLITGVALIHRH